MNWLKAGSWGEVAGRILLRPFLFYSMPLKIFLKYLLLALVLYSCASVPKFTSKKNVREKNEKNLAVSKLDSVSFTSLGDPSKTASKVLYTEIGVASYYADKFNGKRTASGEIYNMYGLSAAHPTFPLGTIARITNLKNGRSVIVKINDRMPKRPDRVIDLSLGAAKLLGMVRDGITKVKIEVLKWGDNVYRKE